MEETLDTLDDGILNQNTYTLASKGKRFGNYLIDVIGAIIFALIIGVIVGIILFSSGNETFLLEEPEPTAAAGLIELMINIAFFVAYYTIIEYTFKGKTLGKLITKTRAVTIDNERMDFQTTLVRSLCRLIPFEAFSFLGEESTGWHDSMSNTKVIDDVNWVE